MGAGAMEAAMYFEDVKTGTEYKLEPIKMTETEILAFARQFDPQGIHTDPDFAEAGPFGGLIASGYHTLAAVWRKWVDAGVMGDESMGGPGLERLQWLAPVRPGDVLQTTVTVVATHRSQNKPRGVMQIRIEVSNQTGERVMAVDGVVLLKLIEP